MKLTLHNDLQVKLCQKTDVNIDGFRSCLTYYRKSLYIIKEFKYFFNKFKIGNYRFLRKIKNKKCFC